MTECAEKAGLPAAAVADVRLAFSEAVSNVVRHAYEGRAVGLVAVEATTEGGALTVVVEDFGRGLRPRPRGELPRLGMSIIAAVCDVALSATREGGLRLEMRFEAAAVR